jgi:hypothetical protein
MCFVILRIIWPNFLRAIWHIVLSPFLPHASLALGVRNAGYAGLKMRRD